MESMSGNTLGSEEEQFCLRWNDFQESLLTTLQSLRDEESLVDVTLLCASDRGAGHVAMKAHRLILSACSDVFKNILAKIQSPNPVIVLWEVAGSDLRRILRFMYHGEVEVQQAHLEPFLAVAEKLRVRGLCQGTPVNNESSMRSESGPNSPFDMDMSSGGNKKAKKRRRRRSGGNASGTHHLDLGETNALKMMKDEQGEEGESRDSLTPALMAPQTSLTEGSNEGEERNNSNEEMAGANDDQNNDDNDQNDNACDGNSENNSENSGLINLPGFPRTPQMSSNTSSGNGNYARSDSTPTMQLPPPHLMGMNLGSPLDPSTAKEFWRRAAMASMGLAGPAAAAAFRGSGSGSGYSDSSGGGDYPLRRQRSVYSSQQIAQLEGYFQVNEYIDGDRKRQLSQLTNISEQQIKVWFQNRRQKKKRELEEQQQQQQQQQMLPSGGSNEFEGGSNSRGGGD